MKRIADLIEFVIRTHFDKLFLFIVFGGLVVIAALSPFEMTKTWAMDRGDTIIGAIIVLATREAAKLAAGIKDKKSEEHQEDKP